MSIALGLVGCGRIAERGYVPAAAGLTGVAIAATCDSNPLRAAAVAGAAGARPFAEASEMLEAGGIDGVLIATPAATHLDLASLAAAAGLPSLVEKPPAASAADAAALAALDPPPAIGFNRRLLQGSELAARIPPDGWLELDLELRFRRGGWGAHEARDESLLDAGIHLVDLARFLARSEPIAVRRAAIGPERASLELELTRGRARIRCATDRPYAERVEVRDRAGRTIADWRIGRLRAALRRARGGEDPLVASLRRQLRCFAERIDGGDGTVLAGAADGARAMAVVDAARRSAELEGAEVTVEVPVPEPIRGRP